MRFAVPTRGRAQTVADGTLRALGRAGVPPSLVDLWVDSDEEQAYRWNVAPTLFDQIIVGPPGTNLRDKRNTVSRGYPVGTRLVQCDDDITAFWYAFTRQRPLHALVDLVTLAEWAFDTGDALGIGLWGMYPVDNPYFMRPYATTDLRYIAGPCWGMTVHHDDTELVTFDDKEDFERSVRFAIRDGGVLRLNWASYSTNYYGSPGGMQTYRTPEGIADAAARLVATYPDHVTFDTRKNHRNTAEVRLRRGQPVAPLIPAPSRWSEAVAYTSKP